MNIDEYKSYLKEHDELEKLYKITGKSQEALIKKINILNDKLFKLSDARNDIKERIDNLKISLRLD